MERKVERLGYGCDELMFTMRAHPLEPVVGTCARANQQCTDYTLGEQVTSSGTEGRS